MRKKTKTHPNTDYLATLNCRNKKNKNSDFFRIQSSLQFSIVRTKKNNLSNPNTIFLPSLNCRNKKKKKVLTKNRMLIFLLFLIVVLSNFLTNLQCRNKTKNKVKHTQMLISLLLSIFGTNTEKNLRLPKYKIPHHSQLSEQRSKKEKTFTEPLC